MSRLISLRPAAGAALASALAAFAIVAALLGRAPGAGALPPAGTDELDVTGLVSASSRLGSETISVNGTMTVERGDPYLEGAVEVVDAEIVALSLSGESLTGPVTIAQSQTLASLGEIRSLQPPPDQFPASSFFDIFVDVTVPGSPSGPLTLYNDVALRMVPTAAGVEVPLKAWPPVGVLYHAEPNPAGASGAEPQTWPPGEPHCTSGERLLPSLPAKVCIDSVSIVVSGSGTPTPAPTKQPEPGDTDADGCTDVAENGPEARFGGQRSHVDFWDFYDVWTRPPGDQQSWERNAVINILDILAVANRFGPGTLMGHEEAYTEALIPPADTSSYHPAYDRGQQIGAMPWNALPPDGAINVVDDILGVAAQFGHDCS